jgi:FlaA1/EpsC-like NDP-sugar epimerase
VTDPILVTGAGGYIGSALVRAIAAAGPARILLLDSSEQNLFGIHRYLEAAHPGAAHEAILGNVTDAALLHCVFRQFSPSLVYHAAAFKHVPLLELNPLAALRNNTMGTYALAKAALEHGASSLVLVSTDKAVNPHSIMGASKRLAELIVATLASPRCRMNAIRLGNVVGSTGSVIPIFLEQISARGPVTVTHPEATRYFMSLADAVGAILAAGVAECSGRILLPELGEPESIADLARRLIAAAPGGNAIQIRFIGLRPGEKLDEDLVLQTETREGSTARSLQIILTPTPDPFVLHEHMQQIDCLLLSADRARLIEMICALVPEYRQSSLIRGALG